MPVNLTVAADIVDITSGDPLASDIFLIDTNVLYWFAYSKASLATKYNTVYDAYLKKALLAASGRYVCGLAQSELIHIIERTEQELFDPSLKPKEFRHKYVAQRAPLLPKHPLLGPL